MTDLSLLTFDEARHEYRHAGEVVPSVTQLLGALYSFAGVPPEVLVAAQQRGTDVHTATELLDDGDLDEEALQRDLPEAWAYLQGYKRFQRDCLPAWTQVEQKVYHHQLRYAGTLDRRGDFTFAGRRVIDALLDIKSSASSHPVWGLQTMAYTQAQNRPHSRRFTLQLLPDPQGAYKLLEWTDPQDWPAFVSLVTLRTWSRRHRISI